MARDYATRDFPRQMPPGLPARYFRACNVFEMSTSAANSLNLAAAILSRLLVRYRLGGERSPSHLRVSDTNIDAVLQPARVTAGKPDRCVREHPMQAADVYVYIPK